MIEGFIEEVQSRIKKSVLDLEHHLGRGQSSSWEQYHNAVGRIAGLEMAAGILSQTLAVYQEEEDKE